MVSTLTILLVSVLSLFLVWTSPSSRLPPGESLEDWEAKNTKWIPKCSGFFSIPPKSSIFAGRFLRTNSAPFRGGAWLWRCMRFAW